MKEILIKLFAFLKDFWNVYGAIFLSAFLGWLVDWNTTQLITLNQYIGMTISIMCLLTMIKFLLFPKKKPIMAEKIIRKQGVVKNLENTIEFENNFKEKRKQIKNTMKGSIKIMNKLKKFIKWVWGNKFTLIDTFAVIFIATCIQLATYTEYMYRFEFFEKNEQIIKIVSPILVAIYVFVDLYTTYTKYGCESVEELQRRAEQKKNEKLTQLTKEQRLAVKNRLDVLKKQLKTMTSELTTLNKDVSYFETLQQIGTLFTQRDIDTYNKNKNEAEKIKNNVKCLENEINKLKNTL